MKTTAQRKESSIDNIYRLDGRVPIGRAIPFGLQHVLAMFVANVAPLIIIASVAVYNGAPFTAAETAQLLQNCMLIAGIGTLVQLYPVWKIGSGLPVVMGLSFTFLAAAMTTASQDYGVMVGAIIVGGCFEGILGLTAKYWRRIISPTLSACVVISIGLSILNVGVSSFGSSSAYPLGSWQNLLVAVITLAAALVFHTMLKGVAKQLYVLLGMLVGYVVSIFFGMVDFGTMADTIGQLGVVAVPRLFAYVPKFQIGAIFSFALVFIVSAVETIGDTTATCTGGLGRDITEKELSGSLCCDGFVSAISGGVFGCSPITSFSQNVGLISMTHVVNRYCIMFGALAMILGGLFPPVGAFFTTLPDCVLGGCTVIMFGSIMMSGVKMLQEAGLNNRSTLIAATSICLGVGVTEVDGFFDNLPAVFGDVFAGNMVAGVFVVGLIMELCLPKDPARYETRPAEKN
ncbi:uracil-xanthine permease family protein [Dysosmobacter sp.]|uniref:uracil-xanthine permease family protein n=1 Tax=Dysosmobacter sp. TaxID=2591382 RepID=UPI002A99A950|nr:solute carrier family 23 protein [Dysosmobacter sp.]MCI6055030.1 purine/pyrimidine permease [Dysosmobacter sp.]MDY5510765.1 solute carrier family 23 protein [Dysosmobacter sp.]